MLALQSQTAAGDDGGLDALTLILVVVFIVSVALLTGLMLRQSRGGEAAEPDAPSPPGVPPSQPPALPRTTTSNPVLSPNPTVHQPAWLLGVQLPSQGVDFIEVSSVVLELLDARRAGDLARGLALYSGSMRERFRRELGAGEATFDESITRATFDPSIRIPDVRAIEVVERQADRVVLRVRYWAGSNEELYRLVREAGRWAIDGIEPVASGR